MSFNLFIAVYLECHIKKCLYSYILHGFLLNYLTTCIKYSSLPLDHWWESNEKWWNIQNPVHTQPLGTWQYSYSPQCDTGIYTMSPHIQLTLESYFRYHSMYMPVNFTSNSTNNICSLDSPFFVTSKNSSLLKPNSTNSDACICKKFIKVLLYHQLQLATSLIFFCPKLTKHCQKMKKQ